MDWFYFQFILMFAAMLSILVAAHEYGHFLFAKLCGMEVEEFSIGFGSPSWTFMRRKGTEYKFRPIPFGGFVRIKGMTPEEDGSEINVEGGFYSKSPYKRFVTLLAGPVFSILAGLAILIPLHSLYGYRVLGTTVEVVSENMPAARAGLQKGDRILSVDGAPVSSMFDVITHVRDKAGQPVVVTYDRAGRELTATMTPELSAEPLPYVINPRMQLAPEDKRQGRIGLGPSNKQLVVIREPIGTAVSSAFMWPVDMVRDLFKIVKKPSTFKDNVGGPGTIVKESFAAAKSGLDMFIELAALLSISLGIFNIMPFPPFDGGQMLMAVIEMFRRRRLSLKVQMVMQSLGLAMLLMLFASVILVDVNRFTQNPDAPASKK